MGFSPYFWKHPYIKQWSYHLRPMIFVHPFSVKNGRGFGSQCLAPSFRHRWVTQMDRQSDMAWDTHWKSSDSTFFIIFQRSHTRLPVVQNCLKRNIFSHSLSIYQHLIQQHEVPILESVSFSNTLERKTMGVILSQTFSKWLGSVIPRVDLTRSSQNPSFIATMPTAPEGEVRIWRWLGTKKKMEIYSERKDI